MRLQRPFVGACALTILIAAIAIAIPAVLAQANPAYWKSEWPNTDFTKHSIDYGDVLSGGPPRDGIPSIDNPKFVPLAAVDSLAPTEPVIGLAVNGVARAYPLRVLIWHEIVNDVIGGVPVAVTYCPLCNAAIVFDRRVDGAVLEFGTTGKLRHSDLIMYDRQSDSWWQQFLGEGIVGSMTGKRLKTLPARLESFEKFAARHPNGEVLVPNDPSARAYGANPYVGYDNSGFPFLYKGEVPEGIAPLGRVVVVGETAWTLELLREQKKIKHRDLLITWEPGQNSALDARLIAKGRDVGNVLVQRRRGNELHDIPYDVTFAFVFLAFKPEGTLLRK
ncbi:MAG: DUF3179 domain-containing protein [Proteobacteria bacterium]|nr:DUF3179 domain-containing protein [Pseudomonadota bacterium]MDA1308566.1 DUF3179 domain-containing protein [Pseudomonadota bacterium]